MGHRENESRERRAARVSALARMYAAALVAGDEVAAEIAICEALDANLSAAEIDDEVVGPVAVGGLWELRARSEITCVFDGVWTRLTPPARRQILPVFSRRAGDARHAQPLVKTHNLFPNGP
jgi:hypothetical protein